MESAPAVGSDFASRLFCLPSQHLQWPIDAANNSPPSRSYYHKSVSLQDWWLTKPQTVDDRKRIGVSGLTCTSQLYGSLSYLWFLFLIWSRAERCFSSAPILKAYDFFELETVDGICVILQGYINKEKTLQSGFSSEVFDHFVIGFPPYWEEFSTNCSNRGSSDDYISRANEDGKDSIDNFDDTCTMDTEVEDCKDEPTMKAADEVISDAEGNDSLLKKNLKMECMECFCSRRTTRSMTKMDSSKKGLEKIDTRVKAEIIHRLTRSMKASQNKKKKKKKEVKSKKKLTFECEMAKSPTFTSTPEAANEKSATNVLSPECFSGKRSRSGRVLLPSLEFWRNQTVVYDAGLDDVSSFPCHELPLKQYRLVLLELWKVIT
ncbi:hypothetical protein L1887_14773 [Cichorium endivia]|nr:hypothetical protein L1887_14773 [Cichorium endivia]